MESGCRACRRAEPISDAEVERILQAAVKRFARQGGHKITIADFAQAITLTSGAVLHHFASKEALLEAVVDWPARGIHTYSDFAAGDTGGSPATVEKVLVIRCDHFKRNPQAAICRAALAMEFAGSNHPIERRVKEVYGVFVETFL